MVTKQQQLEWLAKNLDSWHEDGDRVCVVGFDNGYADPYFPVVHPHGIRKREWQQEREKMQKQHDFDIGSNLKVSVAATSNGFGEMKINTLWHERAEFPPVGTICEMLDDKNTWLECEIIAHKNSFCIGWISSRNAAFYTYDNSEFRPLRTEREKAIEDMSRIMHQHDSVINDTTLGALYDAGYRKVELRPSPI